MVRGKGGEARTGGAGLSGRTSRGRWSGRSTAGHSTCHSVKALGRPPPKVGSASLSVLNRHPSGPNGGKADALPPDHPARVPISGPIDTTSAAGLRDPPSASGPIRNYGVWCRGSCSPGTSAVSAETTTSWSSPLAPVSRSAAARFAVGPGSRRYPARGCRPPSGSSIFGTHPRPGSFRTACRSTTWPRSWATSRHRRR